MRVFQHMLFLALMVMTSAMAAPHARFCLATMEFMAEDTQPESCCPECPSAPDDKENCCLLLLDEADAPCGGKPVLPPCHGMDSSLSFGRQHAPNLARDIQAHAVRVWEYRSPPVDLLTELGSRRL
jgi:hypothetical protein